MTTQDYTQIFTTETLEQIFPPDRADRFFDALYGDSSEGAYDIHLKFKGSGGDKLHFEFHLRQRAGKCLACNLTYGLPDVFGRHPVIDVKGVVQRIGKLLSGNGVCRDWKLGRTREISGDLHVVPLTITLG